MLQEQINDNFVQCRPWDTHKLQDNSNILNNLKQNLLNYEKGYKKYSIKTKSQLPYIKTQHNDSYSIKQRRSEHKKPQKQKIKTIDSRILNYSKKKNTTNKSVQLTSTKSQYKLTKNHDYHKRGMTSIQGIRQKQNKETIVTERERKMKNKSNFKSKVFLIAFDDQNRYRRLAKRQLHQMVFGQRQKQKYQYPSELR